MNDAMQELKDDIGSDLVRIEDKLRDKWGMHGIDSTSLFARDSSNDNMHIWLTNDQAVDMLVWHPGWNHPAEDRGWVLGVLRPRNRSGYQEPDFYALVYYDHVGIGAGWRSHFATLEPYSVEIVKWSYLPQIGGGNEG